MKSESVYYPSFLSNDLKDLLKKIFVKNPKNRFTIEQIISHPWVSK
jgi:5'-AMP-activated protein kinase catalytic alpha subunit